MSYFNALDNQTASGAHGEIYQGTNGAEIWNGEH
jgi:hypothetical protein